MSDEDLQRNAFWLALNSKAHAALFQSVAQNRLIVCVPVQASMPAHVVLDKYYLGGLHAAHSSTRKTHKKKKKKKKESHVFEASAFFPNEFMSVNKKTVEIKNKVVET